MGDLSLFLKITRTVNDGPRFCISSSLSVKLLLWPPAAGGTKTAIHSEALKPQVTCGF